MKDQIKNDIKIIRGMFPTELFLGGSYARSLILPINNYEVSDVDLFVVSPRKCESWVVLEFLSKYFDIETNEDHNGYYKIPHQYMYINMISKESGIKYDVIFIWDYNNVISDIRHHEYYEILYGITASKVSNFYMNIDYSESMFDMTNAKQIGKELMFGDSDVVEFDMTLSTPAHLEKTIKFLKLFNEYYSTNLKLKVI